MSHFLYHPELHERWWIFCGVKTRMGENDGNVDGHLGSGQSYTAHTSDQWKSDGVKALTPTFVIGIFACLHWVLSRNVFIQCQSSVVVGLCNMTSVEHLIVTTKWPCYLTRLHANCSYEYGMTWLYTDVSATVTVPVSLRFVNRLVSTPWAIKRSQLVFVCNFIKNQQILMHIFTVRFTNEQYMWM